jgi:hypothetical protein
MKLWICDSNEPVFVYSSEVRKEISISRAVASKNSFPCFETLAVLWRPVINFREERVDITGLVYNNRNQSYRMESFSLMTRPKQRKGRKA